MTDWAIYIDWDKDRSFDDVLDDITADVMSIKWRLGMGRAYQNVTDESTCTIQVNNETGKYTPQNPASPLYGKLLPHRAVKVVALVDDTPQTMWRGWVDDIQIQWEPGAEQTGKMVMTLRCIGAKKLIQDTEVNLPLQVEKRADQIIGAVLRRVVLPPASSGAWLLGVPGYSELGVTTRLGTESDYADLESGVYTFATYGEVRESDEKAQDGYKIIHEVTQAERGRFFFDRSGKAIFWNRDHLLDDVVDDAVLDSSGVAGVRPHDLHYIFGASLANQVRVTYFPRKVAPSPITLWTLDTPTVIPAGVAYVIDAPYRDATNQRAGGLAVEVAQQSYSLPTVSLSLQNLADRSIITAQNTGEHSTTINTLELAGTPITHHNRAVASAIDTASIVAYGKRGELKLNLNALDDHATAQEIADFELERRKDPRGEVAKVTLVNQAQQVAWQIGDRVRVKLAELGHDLSYFIIGEEHTISDTRHLHRTTFVLEPAIIQRLAAHSKANQDDALPLQSAAEYSHLGQSFQIVADNTVGYVRLWLKRVGSPAGNLSVKLYSSHIVNDGWRLGVSKLGTETKLNSDGYVPNALLTGGTSGTVGADTLSTEYAWVRFTFDTPPELDGETEYWLVLESSASADAANYVEWGADSGAGYTPGEMKFKKNGRWNAASKDACFEVYAPLP